MLGSHIPVLLKTPRLYSPILVFKDKAGALPLGGELGVFQL